MKIFRLIILTLFGLFIFAALFLESPPGKRLVEAGLMYALKRSGLKIEVGSFSGRLPQVLDLKDVHIRDINGYDLLIEKMHIELGLLPLLGGEIRIEWLEADQVYFQKKVMAQLTSPAVEEKKFTLDKLPLAISLKSIHATHVHWENLPEFEVEGNGAIRRRGRSAYIHVNVKRYDTPDAILNLVATRNRFGKLDAAIELETSTLNVLRPWIKEEAAEGTLHVHATLKGTIDEFTGTVDGRFHGTRTGVLPLQLFKRDWSFKSRIQKRKQEKIRFQRLLASTQGLRLQGSADLDEKNAFNRAQLEFRVDLDAFSFPVPMSGTLIGTGDIKREANGFQTHATWNSPALTIGQEKIERTSGFIDGLLGEKSFLGKLEAEAQYLQEPWTLKTPIVYRANSPLIFENIQIESPLLYAKGDMVLRPDGIWVGTIQFEKADLQIIQRLTQRHVSFGLASGKCILQASEQEPPTQKISAYLNGRDVKIDGVYAYQIKTSGEWTAKEPGNFFLELNGVEWGRLKLETALFEMFSAQEKYPARIVLNGTLKTPLELRMDGFWIPQEKGFMLSLESAQGTLFNHPISLLQPSLLQWTLPNISWDRLYLSFGDGLFDGSLQREENKTDINLHLKNIPIDVLSINPLETKVAGAFDADAKFIQRGVKTDADWKASLYNGRIESEGARPLSASGTMEGALHNNRLQFKSLFDVLNKPLFALNLDMPLEVTGWPPNILLPPDGPISGKLFTQGPIEDLLDFFNLGMHQLEGDTSCDLSLSGSLDVPHLEGTCRLINGYYQNYLTGTQITHIEATLQGKDNHLVLTSLTGQDYLKKGSVNATGNILFSLKDWFPFHFDLDFARLNIVQIDLINAETHGHVSINGSLRSAKAVGNLEIIESEITIPDKISRSYPDLKVVYKNGPPPTEISSISRNPYPLELDFKIRAPEGIFISGRGLTSEWKGDFSVGGTYAEPSADGKLQLINGEFVFAGHRFKLTEGSISLKGNQYKLPIIDIAANTSEKGISITARLRGPLNQPQLTFQSVPPLPLSGILSYLLFGKDLSDVNGLQAIQLAGTVASVAGEGPDIMEITRKSLGVDRLQIVMTPSATGEGADTVSLQVGKILTPGLVLTIRQGADDSSPNIGIEVDLTHGFTFEGERQQQPEQGKFSLKWNLNY